jgi:hypothetical protein
MQAGEKFSLLLIEKKAGGKGGNSFKLILSKQTREGHIL